jgi:hypothetical protein
VDWPRLPAARAGRRRGASRASCAYWANARVSGELVSKVGLDNPFCLGYDLVMTEPTRWGIWPVLRAGAPAHIFSSSDEAHAYFKEHYPQEKWVATIAPIPEGDRCSACGLFFQFGEGRSLMAGKLVHEETDPGSMRRCRDALVQNRERARAVLADAIAVVGEQEPCPLTWIPLLQKALALLASNQ